MLRFAFCLMACVACARPAAPATPCTACALAPMPVQAAPTPQPQLDAVARARWEGYAKGHAVPPAGERSARLAELVALLGSPDPAERDGLAYETLVRWSAADSAFTDAEFAVTRQALVSNLRAAPTVTSRSFAALALSVLAAREVKAPTWTADDLAAQVDAALGYATQETDLRGYLGATGWAHAAAHTADWMKFLARHPALTAAQAQRLLDGLADLATRAHGHRFAHGEDERLAAAALAVVRRGLVTDGALDAWLTRLAAPLARGWPVPFDPVLYAAQRNARDLMVSLRFALTYDDSPTAAAARARIDLFVRG